MGLRFQVPVFPGGKENDGKLNMLLFGLQRSGMREKAQLAVSILGGNRVDPTVDSVRAHLSQRPSFPSHYSGSTRQNFSNEQK